MNNVSTGKTFRLALMGILSALVLLQNFVPFFGYIPTPFFIIIIYHVTVIIGGVVMGPAYGALLGLVWGLVCLYRAFALPTNPIDPIIFTNPVISVLPRVLVGYVAGLLFRFLRNKKVSPVFGMVSAGIAGSLVNTILVLGFIYLFYKEPYANFYGLDVRELLPAMLLVVGTNGLLEAVTAAVLTPAVAKPLLWLYQSRVPRVMAKPEEEIV